MKIQGLLLAGTACAWALILGSVSLGGTKDVAKMGSEVTYTFRASPVNGKGLRSLASLRGKPVLVEFWGMR